ncbi:DUF262 domain-containing protein (plasmid) [Roseomonas sp. OT10]|uniref:DUF262 domain-containing protein n=1 Tax=Roseomonas cutis TaxID=2897332 RepID=UPI001E312F79|nr:DUF262 domain-containing protein [Roseomonas sp. OT10]UFN51779.1 DUF262 domain-containing protein [Roseomonas sp. OT10]
MAGDEAASAEELPTALTEEQKAAAEAQIAEQSKRIEFNLVEYTIEILANKMEDGSFFIPDYQREDTWEDARKSRFVESILMGLPIPFLFFWERPDGRLEIVDGSQRLRTIQQFILGGFRLGELDTLNLISGFRFKDLPESRQRKTNNRSIRGIILNERADERARFDLFERINTGSKIANTAEVRRGALVGPFVRMVIDLARDPAFGELAPVPKAQENMREREELVTRFFAYGDGLEGYKDRVSDFLYDYSKRMNAAFEADPSLEAGYRERFRHTMSFVARVFPHGFRRTPKGTETPRTRFEAIAIGSFQALEERPALASQTPDVSAWIGSAEFKKVIGSDGANAIRRLRDRMEFVRTRLLSA